MVQTRFRQSDVGTPVKIWSYPSKIVDTQFVIFMFSPSATKPLANPLEGDTAGSNGWYKSSEGINVVWMAIGRQVNGVWPTSWEILKMIDERTAAYSYVPSSMFVRSDSPAMPQARPVGKYLALDNGVYTLQGPDPVVSVGGTTYTFTDGIPDYNPSIFPNYSKRIWMIQGILNSKDHLGPANPFQWGAPKLLATIPPPTDTPPNPTDTPPNPTTPTPGTPEVYSISSARSYTNICNVKTDYDTVYVVPKKPGFVSVGDRVYRNSALNLPFIGDDIYANSDVISFKFKNNYNRSFVVSIDIQGKVYASQQCP